MVHEGVADHLLQTFPRLLQQHWLPREDKVHQADGWPAGHLATDTTRLPWQHQKAYIIRTLVGVTL